MDENGSREQVISHYRIIGELGQGGFGRVYRAQNTALADHIVAIKKLHANDPKARKRFEHEASVLLKLNHPYILRFIDFFSDEDDLCLVTDYAGYGSLQDRLNQSSGLLPLEEVCIILSQVGKALQYVHGHKVIHCDLKPENILFKIPGKALLADFGIAKIMADVSMGRGEAIGQGTGTPAYMAPEQIRGKPTPKSDQYAFACVAYRLLTGRTPFRGPPQRVMLQHLTEQPADPRTFNKDIPEQMALAILKGLAKEPRSRYADMNAFLAALGMQEASVTTSQTSMPQQVKKELLDQGKMLLQEGRSQEALKIFKNVLDHDYRSVEAHYGKGEALKQNQRYWDALTEYSEIIINLNPQFVPAHIGRGDTYCALELYREGIDAYRRAVELAPDPPVFLKMASACEKCGKHAEALAAYGAALRYGADPIETGARKIKLLRALKDYREVMKEYNTIIRISSDPLPICYEKIQFLLSIRSYDQALIINEVFATYEHIIKLKQGATEIYYEEIATLENLTPSLDKRLEFFRLLSKRVPDPIKVYVYSKMVELLKLLKRSQDVSAIYDQIVELAPHNLQIHREKLAFLEDSGWPEVSREAALATCEQIIMRVPIDFAAHRAKLTLLELLKRPVQTVVDECDQLLVLDSNDANIYHRRGKAYEMLAGAPEKRKKNVLSARLSRISEWHLSALADYEEAAQRAPDNSNYRKSKEELLNRLGKPNQAELSQRLTRRHLAVARLCWVLPFLVLPTLVNTGIGMFLLLVLQHLDAWLEVIVGAFSLSVFGIVLIRANDKPYHLYSASLLIFPVVCFPLGWLVLGFFISQSGVSVNFSLLLFSSICIFIVNIILYFLIDFYEEQTFVFIGAAIVVVALGTLAGLAAGVKRIDKEIIAYNERQARISEQKRKEERESRAARARKAAMNQRLSPKTPAIPSRGVKTASSRQGSSFRKPLVSSPARSFSKSHPRHANTIKKTIPRKGSSSRRN